MLKLYRFDWDCGRMGDVTGTFVADDGDVSKIIGEHVYFGEILGKHSEIHGELEKDSFTILTDDQDFIAKFVELKCSSGHNPFHYLEDAG